MIRGMFLMGTKNPDNSSAKIIVNQATNMACCWVWVMVETKIPKPKVDMRNRCKDSLDYRSFIRNREEHSQTPP